MLSKFSSALLIEAYMETTEGFAGEQADYISVGTEGPFKPDAYRY